VEDWIEPMYLWQLRDHLMKIVAFLRGAAFEPEDIEVMDQAFATAALVPGIPSDDDERAQEVARTVIEFATAGERDVVTLTDRVLQRELQRAQPGVPGPQ
jgi:hypothetical protein